MATVTETHCHPSPKLKLNELFVQWFNLPETQHAISLVLDEAVNASDDRAAGASFAPSHGTPDVQRLLHLSISADGRSPPASPTANGFSHLSLSSSPRTPPRSPELHTTHLDGTSRGRRGAAGESDVIAATVKAATSPSALALSSTHSALAAAAAADMADAGGEGALAVGGAPSLVSPRSRRARAGSRLAAPAALSPQKRSLSLVRHEDDATHGDESGRRLSSAGGAAAGGSGVADGGGKKSKDFVPPFYQPLGRQPPAARELESAHVRDEIARAASGAAVLPYDLALAICVGPLQLPAAAARVLLGRLVRQAAEASGGGEMADDPPAISVALFARFADELAVGFPLGARVFHALANEGSAWLDASDLRALVRTVVDFHPGLAFLAATPEFQERYVETVVLRIIYTIARCGAPTVSRSALQRSALPAALAALDVEDDINASSAFFSYEHFYVIYCKFWELDDDHDMHLSRDDLARYADYSLSSRIVERVYALATSEAAAASVHLPPPLATAPQADDAGGAGGGAPAAAEGEGNGEARMTYPHFVCASRSRVAGLRQPASLPRNSVAPGPAPPSAMPALPHAARLPAEPQQPTCVPLPLPLHRVRPVRGGQGLARFAGVLVPPGGPRP